MSIDVLPDSRLIDSKRTVMVDWKWTRWDEFGVPHPEVTRMELEPIYCFGCGRDNGYVPREVMSFVSWLCLPCSVKWGEVAHNHVTADHAFWQKVGEEVMKRFGRAITQQELNHLAEQGRLGRGLELLERESPYIVRRAT